VPNSFSPCEKRTSTRYLMIPHRIFLTDTEPCVARKRGTSGRRPTFKRYTCDGNERSKDFSTRKAPRGERARAERYNVSRGVTSARFTARGEEVYPGTKMVIRDGCGEPRNAPLPVPFFRFRPARVATKAENATRRVVRRVVNLATPF